MKIFRVCFAGMMLMAASYAPAKDYDLVKDGKPASCIVLADNAGVVEKHAATELAAFLAKISGSSGQVAIGQTPVKDLYPIYLELVSDQRINSEGFCLKADRSGLRIQGKEPIGVLYGVYNILKQYGGIRWLVPGEDGEYFTVRPTITVPALDEVQNPSFRIRNLHFVSASVDKPKSDTYNWMVRNNLRIEDWSAFLEIPGIKSALEGLSPLARNGYHCFNRLLCGEGISVHTAAEVKAATEALFREHPEYFPLISGKRVICSREFGQPCTSNPDVIRIMADNLVKHLALINRPDGRYNLCNNDNTRWCQCPDCVRIDPPDEQEIGSVATRYWTFLNQLAQEVYKHDPNAELWGEGYQNFQAPPTGVKPDKRLHAFLSYNRRCYRHKLTDPKCLTNKIYYDYFKRWSAMGMPVSSYEEIDASAVAYMPTEHTFIDGLKTYHQLKMEGTTSAIMAPDGVYGKRYDGTLVPLAWYGMWQTMYLSAVFHWNIEADYDALYEEAGSLYYGKAWPAGMRAFRALLIKTASETPGCYGHNHNNPLGRCLDAPGAHEKLLEHLAQAESAVKDDPRALAHVRRDRMLFGATWETFRRQYLASYREIRAYGKTATIRIDGVLDEPDWKNADVTTQFKVDAKTLVPVQTFVKITYEPDFIYFGIEAMEPEPERIATQYNQHDGNLWEDNGLEIFINYPDLDNKYYHLIFNSSGALYDALNMPGNPPVADRAWDSQAEVSTKILKDRWVAEVKIPTAMLAMKCLDGDTWKINIARSRILKGGSSQSSSWSEGAAHGVECFHPVAFAGTRTLALGSGAERDTRLWRNGTFNEVVSTTNPGAWKIENNLLPDNWNRSGPSGSLAMKTHPGMTSNYYLQLNQGRIFQYHKGTQKDLRINFRACGQGLLDVVVYRSTRSASGDSGSNLDTTCIGQITLQPEWKDYRYDYAKPDSNNVVALAFHYSDKAEDCRIDDVFVMSNDQR